MKIIGSSEAKLKFSQILRAVSDGEQFLITKYGKPVAKLVPADVRARRAAASVIQDLVTHQTRSDCGDISLEELSAARDEGRH